MWDTFTFHDTGRVSVFHYFNASSVLKKHEDETTIHIDIKLTLPINYRLKPIRKYMP